MSARPIDVAKISAVLQELLRASGKPVCIADLATGELQDVSLGMAASPTGLLPLFLAAGDAVWRQATGRRLGIVQAPDPNALLGMRTAGIAPGPVVPVLVSTMEAITQAERPNMLLVNDLNHHWKMATEKMRRAKQAAAILAVGNVPQPVRRGVRP